MRELAHLHQMLRSLRLLGLLVKRRCSFSKLKDLNFVSVSLHEHATNGDGDRKIVLVVLKS